MKQIENPYAALRPMDIVYEHGYAAGYEQGKIDSAYDPLTAVKVAGEMLEKESKAYADGYDKGKRDAVVHADWIVDKVMTVSKLCHCSNCGEKKAIPLIGKGLKHCAECGARMDDETTKIN